MTIPDPSPQILAHRVSTRGIAFQLRKDPRSVLEVPGRDNTVIAIHIGPSARIACHRGGRWFRGTAVHGDIDIIPANTPARWEMLDKDGVAELLVSLPPSLLDSILADTSNSGFPIELRNRRRFAIRSWRHSVGRSSERCRLATPQVAFTSMGLVWLLRPG